MYYVYELWNPITNLPFYVGKGTGNRAEKHLKYLDDADSSLKANIIRKILSEGKVPEIRKVMYTEDKDVAYEEEKRLIAFYGRRCDSTGILANIMPGGEGGDTVSGVDPEKVSARYLKKANTIQQKSDDEKKITAIKRSASMKENWKTTRDDRLEGIARGIAKRDKVSHANAVSEGWKNRTDNEKKELAERRKIIRERQWKDPSKRASLLKGSEAVSIPVRITDSSGNVFEAASLAAWCNQTGESYSVLWEIMHGRGPKPNKYKRSKYLGWKVEKK